MLSGVFISRIREGRNTRDRTVSSKVIKASSSIIPPTAFRSLLFSWAPKDWVTTTAKPLFSPQAMLKISP